MNSFLRRRWALRTNDERGQILVIFAGGLLLLLGIAALVIDLGFVFMLRRMEQNVADPAAIAAARYIRANGNPDVPMMRQTACYYARQNGLFPSAPDNNGCIPANDPDGTILTVNYPPSTGAGPRLMGRDGFVRWSSRAPTTASLPASSASAAFPFQAAQWRHSMRVTRTPTRSSFLDPDDCGALTVTGTGDLVIAPATGVTGDGGNVMVNSNCPTGTDATPNACASGGSGGAAFGGGGDITAPHLYVVGRNCKGHRQRLGQFHYRHHGARQLLRRPDGGAHRPGGQWPGCLLRAPRSRAGARGRTLAASTPATPCSRFRRGSFYGGPSKGEHPKRQAQPTARHLHHGRWWLQPSKRHCRIRRLATS